MLKIKGTSSIVYYIVIYYEDKHFSNNYFFLETVTLISIVSDILLDNTINKFNAIFKALDQVTL